MFMPPDGKLIIYSISNHCTYAIFITDKSYVCTKIDRNSFFCSADVLHIFVNDFEF